MLSWLLMTLLIGMVYRILPDVRIGWRDVAWGSAVTAVLFLLGKYAIGYYLRTAAVTSAYGAAGSLVLILVWVYYSSLIFLLGAEFTRDPLAPLPRGARGARARSGADGHGHRAGGDSVRRNHE